MLDLVSFATKKFDVVCYILGFSPSHFSVVQAWVCKLTLGWMCTDTIINSLHTSYGRNIEKVKADITTGDIGEVSGSAFVV